MEHLTPETLARLVDEAPTEVERTHLEGCTECASELETMREQTLGLGTLPDLRPPKGDWGVLEARMVSEGLVRNRNGLLSRMARTPAWMKGAAAAVLFFGGAGIGFGAAQSSLLRPVARTADLEGPTSFTSTSVSSVDEAAAALRMAERRYVDALVQLRQMTVDGDPALSSGDNGSRLAALEHLIAAGRAAVQQSPADPFMNGLLANLLAEQEMTRQESLEAVATSGDWF